jgi:protease-3
LKGVTLPEVVRTYETMIQGPGGTRAVIQIRGSRFRDFGWARKAGATQVEQPEDFHRLMGRQRYQGL